MIPFDLLQGIIGLLARVLSAVAFELHPFPLVV
jgi:hypothetical protein